MIVEPTRTLSRDLGPASAHTDLAHLLNGLVVLSVGRGAGDPTAAADDGGALPVIGICARTMDDFSPIAGQFQGVLVDPFEPRDVARTVLRVMKSSS